ncbi:acyltransferase [Shinella daejeonensis]|uniref:acyltransferase family protein n=1 Tax=Shinella daejeonensis TaxID=659017 RepID=UPI0020C764C5|nr:acyltransferase family protein [Shinella daejeonensis]MCP8895772.1 acyltransferase [Shinella daejeonensis]
MNYASSGRRPDIDGLRALAVLLVVLYHAQLKDFRGGFIGVDVFFVISGYLIIPMICSARIAGTFSYRQFMLRRLRRLVPAMIPPMVVAAAAGFLLLGQQRFLETLDGLLGAAFFVSNHVFLNASDYFGTDASELLFLHTWSLGVEFQFYVVTPVLIGLCGRNRNRISLMLLALSGLSFLAAEYLMTVSREAAFFLTAPRFWEFAAGGLVALWVSDRGDTPAWKTALARAAGLGLILWTAFTLDRYSYFPGHGALLPVIGSMLFLAAPHAARDPVLRLMSSRPASWLGLRSYSIYLWHWPLIVIAVLYADRVNDAVLLSMAALSIVLSAVSYRYIERPPQIRPEWRSPPRIIAVSSLLPAAAVVAFAAQSIYGQQLREGLPFSDYRERHDIVGREKERYLKLVHMSGDDLAGYQCSLDGVAADAAAASAIRCISSAPYPSAVMVIGDSHGRDVYHALRRAFPETDFILYHASGCPPATMPGCFPGLRATLEATVAGRVSAIVLASSWPERGQPYLADTAEILKNLAVPVAVIGASPISRTAVPNMVFHHRESREEDGAIYLGYKAVNARSDARAKETWLAAWADENGWPFIPKLARFCSPQWCLVAQQDEALRLLFWDNQHLTDRGISFLADYFSAEPALVAFMGHDDPPQAAKARLEPDAVSDRP